jgi:hypothetical protein
MNADDNFADDGDRNGRKQNYCAERLNGVCNGIPVAHHVSHDKDSDQYHPNGFQGIAYLWRKYSSHD